MPDAVPGRVFISYRRQDARGSAGRIYDRLADRFGSDQIFMDVDNLPPGADFAKVITQAVSNSRVLLAIIGPHWVDAKEGRRRRLDDPGDLVRMEIAAALERDTVVIPILVEDAAMPRRQELPGNLADLAARNAHRVRHESFRSDVDRLLEAIEPILRAVGAAPVASAARDQVQQEPTAPPGRRRTRTPPPAPVGPSRMLPDRIRLSRFAGTDVGLERPGNEDSYLCGRTVFVVADGFGDHQSGAVASAMAMEHLVDLDGRAFADATEAAQALASVIGRANQAILQQSRADLELSGMGTTVTAAAVVGDEVLQLAHVGNSRAYRLREGTLGQLTTDHTVVPDVVDRGELTRFQAAVISQRGEVPRAVGLYPDVRLDLLQPLSVRPGDQVLLCTDGLTEVVDEDRIAAVLADEADGDDACRTLIAAANEGGGPDNITIVLLRW